ncbi:MAG: SpoIIE family protein phosphatase [Clostridia bacterium]|nr:SpoIIE family protein phosphatase [Clostridia bacterium]
MTAKKVKILLLSVAAGLLSVADKHYSLFYLCAPTLTASAERIGLSRQGVLLGQLGGLFFAEGRQLLPLIALIYLVCSLKKRSVSPILLFSLSALYQGAHYQITGGRLSELLLGLCAAVLSACALFFTEYIRDKQAWTARLVLSLMLLMLTDSVVLGGISMQVSALLLILLWGNEELWHTAIGTTVIALSAAAVGGEWLLLPIYPAAAAAVCVMQSGGKKRYATAALLCSEAALLITGAWREYPLWLISPPLSSLIFMFFPNKKRSSPVSTDELPRRYDDLVRQVEGLEQASRRRISFYPEIASRATELLTQTGAQDVRVTCAKDLLGGFFLDAAFTKKESQLTTAALLGLMERACGVSLAVRRYHDSGEEVYACFVRRPPYTVDCAALCRTKEGETVCGDSALAFRADQNRYVLLLSDGMGSGKDAFAQSRWTVTLLQKLLKAGLRAEGALGMVHSSLKLAQQDIGFATADLCSIDLWKSTASFVKAGAVSAFILSDSEITEVCGISMPLGATESPDMAIVTEQLSPNDLILLISDGAYECKDEILYALQKHRTLPVRELVQKLMHCTDGKSSDDVTVLVARFCKNK